MEFSAFFYTPCEVSCVISYGVLSGGKDFSWVYISWGYDVGLYLPLSLISPVKAST